MIMNFVFTLILSIFTSSKAFKWHLDSTLPSQQYYLFSERYMFPNHDGPPMMEQGASYILVQTDIDVYWMLNNTVYLGFAIYSTDFEHQESNLIGICDVGNRRIKTNTWARHVETVRYEASYTGKQHVFNPVLGLNGTYHKRTIRLNYRYTVTEAAWHNVVFMLCPLTGLRETYSPLQFNTEKGDSPVLLEKGESPVSKGVVLRSDMDFFTSLAPVGTIKGTVSFHNPYGFLPGELYGILPFEGARMVAYVILSTYFLYYFITYKDSLLTLHKAFLAVLLFALGEAALWYATYQYINDSGEPYCCPFPTTVIVSLVLQIVRQTLSRTLLLVVCLGYGIVRPKLLFAEWSAIAVVSLLYLAAAVVSQVENILLVQNAHGSTESLVNTAFWFEVPEMLLNLVLLSWIYLAIGSTIRILREFKQTVKLRMYQRLVLVIGTFVALFTVVTVVFALDSMNYVKWPWQLQWLQQVLWESLNFSILAAVCVICKPSATSQMLSYASQLPTEDPDDELDDDDLDSVGKPKSKFRFRPTNSLFDDDDVGIELGKKNQKTKKRGKNDFTTLPSAEDELADEYGLDDDDF